MDEEVGHGGLPRQAPNFLRTVVSASVYVVLVYITFSMFSTPFLQLMLERKCAVHGLDATHCHAEVDGVVQPGFDQASKETASFMSLFALVPGLVQLIACSFYGAVSDAFGRRWALLAPQVGMLLSSLCTALLPGEYSTWLLALCTLFAGLGGFGVSNHAAMASVADCSPQASAQQRAKAFSVVEAATFVGALTGPVLGGTFADNIGLRNTYLVTCGLVFGNLLLTFLTYKETLEPELRRRFSLQRANPFAALALFFKNRSVLCLGGVMLFSTFAFMGSSAVLGLHAIRIADFDVLQQGLLGTVSLGGACLGLVFLVPTMTRFISLTHILSLALLNSVGVWLVMSVVQTPGAIFGVLACNLLMAAPFPIVRTGMANQSGQSRFGEALSAVSTLEQSATMLAPAMFLQIYRSSEGVAFQVGGINVQCITFLVGAAFAALGLISSLFLKTIPKNVVSSTSSKPLDDGT